MKQFLSFSKEYHFLHLLSQVRIKNHFPLKSPITYYHRSLRKVAVFDWMSLTTEKRDVSSAKRFQFEDTLFDKSLM